MAVDRLERLTNLVAFLLHGSGPVRLADIVDQVPGYPPGADARRQAFERDKRLLRDERIPIIEESGGYRIAPEDYYLAPLQLDEGERRALRVAVAAVSVSRGAGWAGLAKLGGAHGAGASSPPLGVRAELVDLPALPILHSAVRTRTTVTFVYGGQERCVDPHGLLFRWGHWYVVGHDRLREAQRTFRVDRLEGAVAVGPPAAFEHPEGFDVATALPREPWMVGGDEVVVATVKVDSLLAGRVCGELGAEAEAERRGDGSVIVHIPVTNPQVFRSWVLDLLDHAEVLAPADLRAEVVAWLRAMDP